MTGDRERHVRTLASGKVNVERRKSRGRACGVPRGGSWGLLRRPARPSRCLEHAATSRDAPLMDTKLGPQCNRSPGRCQANFGPRVSGALEQVVPGACECSAGSVVTLKEEQEPFPKRPHWTGENFALRVSGARDQEVPGAQEESEWNIVAPKALSFPKRPRRNSVNFAREDSEGRVVALKLLPILWPRNSENFPSNLSCSPDQEVSGAQEESEGSVVVLQAFQALPFLKRSWRNRSEDHSENFAGSVSCAQDQTVSSTNVVLKGTTTALHAPPCPKRTRHNTPPGYSEENLAFQDVRASGSDMVTLGSVSTPRQTPFPERPQRDSSEGHCNKFACRVSCSHDLVLWSHKASETCAVPPQATPIPKRPQCSRSCDQSKNVMSCVSYGQDQLSSESHKTSVWRVVIFHEAFPVLPPTLLPYQWLLESRKHYMEDQFTSDSNKTSSVGVVILQEASSALLPTLLPYQWPKHFLEVVTREEEGNTKEKTSQISCASNGLTQPHRSSKYDTKRLWTPDNDENVTICPSYGFRATSQTLTDQKHLSQSSPRQQTPQNLTRSPQRSSEGVHVCSHILMTQQTATEESHDPHRPSSSQTPQSKPPRCSNDVPSCPIVPQRIQGTTKTQEPAPNSPQRSQTQQDIPSNPQRCPEDVPEYPIDSQRIQRISSVQEHAPNSSPRPRTPQDARRRSRRGAGWVTSSKGRRRCVESFATSFLPLLLMVTMMMLPTQVLADVGEYCCCC